MDSAANVESCAPSHGAPTVRAPRAHTPRAHTPRAHARSDQDTPRRLRTLTETKSYRRSRGPRSCAAENSATCFARSNRIRAHGPGPAACVLIRRSGQQTARVVIDYGVGPGRRIDSCRTWPCALSAVRSMPIRPSRIPSAPMTALRHLRHRQQLASVLWGTHRMWRKSSIFDSRSSIHFGSRPIIQDKHPPVRMP